MRLMKREVASLNVVPRTLMIALQQHIGPRRNELTFVTPIRYLRPWARSRGSH
jgi:hypothetical protein